MVLETPLRMANSIGLIDYGYRGDIIGCVDCIEEEYFLEQNTRLFQLCSADLSPMKFEIVEELSDSIRNDGSFGSTN